MTQFPSLNGFGPTRRTLQLYSRVIAALPRDYAPAHPNWWHISLKVIPSGLVTNNVPCDGGGILSARMDLLRANVVLESSDGRTWLIPMNAGLSGTEMGERVMAAAAEAGLTREIDRSRFADAEPGVYDEAVVGRFFVALVRADRALKRHGARLGEKAGPVRLWPHGFDMAMEWFGSRVVCSEEGEGTLEQPAQLNIGFYPGEDDESSYFYSNPWPFEADKLLHHPLPDGARWHTDGWQGTMLPYKAARDEEQLLDYGAAVYAIAAPLLNEKK